SVDPGNGMQLDVTGVGIKLPANSGLRADEKSGLSIISGNGVVINSSGVNIKLARGSLNNDGGGQGSDGATSGSAGGLALDSKGLSVDAGDGIKINDKGVSIKLAANSGLSVDEKNGLRLVAEQQFQNGMIMMFSGTSVPSGWALCDGSDGRPDLRNRFVLGASGLSNIGKTNGRTVTGTDTNKQFSADTDSKTPAVSVKVNGHKLTIDQMPPHNHPIKSAGNEGSDGQALFEKKGRSPSHKTTFINSQGSGQEHSHGASGSQSSHSHSVNVVPPYYILAFIIKL
ncbi:tail fiber protein, partial [Serratia nevei]|uniref:tail fiber protein n=1 Tax=Serratia nevei TaxID=2703794 RepID=UPI00313AACBF